MRTDMIAEGEMKRGGFEQFCFMMLISQKSAPALTAILLANRKRNGTSKPYRSRLQSLFWISKFSIRINMALA